MLSGAGFSLNPGAVCIRVTCPAFTVEEAGPTGAGDCFGAACLTCRRLGMAPDRTLFYVSTAGARNVTVQGPMEGAGTFAELDAFATSTERQQ